MKIINDSYIVDSTFIDFPDNESYAVIAFLMGCPHFCDGCQNPQLQRYMPYDWAKLVVDIVTSSKESRTDKVVLSGGDPLMNWHIENTKRVVNKLKELGFKICVYTGFDVDFCKKNFDCEFDFLKCGCYNKKLSRPFVKNDYEMVLASSNQDFYDRNFNKLSNNGILILEKK